MKTENANRKFQWLPILLIAWNLFDIFVHVRADMVEPVRVTGNIVGIVAALILLFGVAKSITPQILGGSAVAVLILNIFHSFHHGFGTAMLVFVGVAVFMLVRLGQMEAVLQSGSGEPKFYLRWWSAILISLIGVVMIVVTG